MNFCKRSSGVEYYGLRTPSVYSNLFLETILWHGLKLDKNFKEMEFVQITLDSLVQATALSSFYLLLQGTNKFKFI